MNEIFPGQRVAPEFNDWNFWKSDLPTVNVQELPISTNNYTGSSSSLLSSTTSVAKKVVSLTHSSSSPSYVQPTSPTSPTSPAFDSKNKRMSYERTTYAGVVVSRQEIVASDDDHEHLANTHATSEQQNALKEDAKKARAGSPSMLSALVPTRLIRAVRSGSMSTAAPTSPTLHSPEMKGMVGSMPSSPSPRSEASDDVARPISIPSPPLLDHMQSDEGVARASRNSVISESVEFAAALAPSSVPKLDLNEALVEVKEEGEDEEVAKHRLLHAGEEAYEDDQDEHYGPEDEGEEYQGDYEDDEGEYMEGEEDEDDEFLDDIEETIEEPFL